MCLGALEGKRRIIFVAPFAHCDGHHCYVACTESLALSNAGEKVLLLTFNGLIDASAQPNLEVRNVVDPRYRQIIDLISSREISKWPFMFLTAFLTLLRASQIYEEEGYSVIHLRDADPFPFLPRLVGLFYKETQWVVSLLATLERVPLVGPLSRLSLWKPIYRISSANGNRYLYVCQNEEVKDYFSRKFLNGLISDSIYELPPMIPNSNKSIPKITSDFAKEHLGLPTGKIIFLSFGSVHKGKDLNTIFSAVNTVPDSICLQAGKTTSNMIAAVNKLKKIYGRNIIFRDNYIPEDEKPFYFAASSAVVLSYAKNFNATSSMLWEACRFGIPVIASRSGDLGQMVESFGVGLTFESQNPESLRDAMIQFMSLDQKRIESLKNNCEKFCNYFSDEEWITRCSELYRKLGQSVLATGDRKSSGHVYITKSNLAPHELV